MDKLFRIIRRMAPGIWICKECGAFNVDIDNRCHACGASR